MGLRPAAAQWFEILTPRDQLTRALRCLAATGAVELQTHSQATSRARLPDMRRGLEEFGELRQRYADWWPVPATQRMQDIEPAEQLVDALAVVRRWAHAADPVIAALQNTRRMSHDLRILRTALAADSGRLPNLNDLASTGPYLSGRLYVMPQDAEIREVPPSVLLLPVRTDDRRFLFAVGEARQIEALDEYLAALKARPLELPRWLPADAEAGVAAVDERVRRAEDDEGQLRARLEAIHVEHGLAPALGRLRLLEWYARHVPELPVTERFAWITGWTSDLGGESIDKSLNDRHVSHLLRVGDPPEDVAVPMVLRNPIWARPFEFFGALLGTPGSEEIDPSRILALMAPLMFGFMFGDVGHGAVLLAVGLAFRKQLPVLSLLVPGGISSMIFGVAFGSVFANEQLIPALWLHPLEQPVTVLVTSLAFGVVVVTLGLGLDAHQCHWRGEDIEFWGSRLGLPMTYFGLLGAFIHPLGLWLAMLGTVWFIAGAALTGREQGLSPAGKAAGEYIETVLQLVVNTVSFVRIGAFALAHAGLSAAVLGMADGVESPVARLAVLTLGNALIIALEGLVVSIQTTRLVLFEFFVRFLRSSGRRFRPLPMPDAPNSNDQRRQQ